MAWWSALILLLSLCVLAGICGRGAARSARGKGQMGGVALAFGLAFSTVLDPPRKAAMEDVKKGKVGRRETADGSAAGVVRRRHTRAER